VFNQTANQHAAHCYYHPYHHLVSKLCGHGTCHLPIAQVYFLKKPIGTIYLYISLTRIVLTLCVIFPICGGMAAFRKDGREMEPSRFDDLTKALATATSRRQALKTIAATTLAGLLGLGGIGTAFAKPKCKPNGHGCGTNKQCCSGYCDPTTSLCACQPGTCNDTCPCPSGQNCCNGTCSECPCGQVKLSNGTCATPCDPNNPESCGGCGCLQDVSGAYYCANPGSSFCCCTTDRDCPRGQLCESSLFPEGHHCFATC
jgi:hypothetical protein